MTNSESVTPPRRLHNARICTDCLQEFPQGRGYAEHDCPEKATTALRIADAPSLMQIIDVLWDELPADVAIRLAGERPDIVDACRAIHELLNHG